MSISALLVTFCALVLVWTFSFSAVVKGRGLSTFAHTIERFALIPVALVTPATFLFVGLEAGTCLMLLPSLIWPAWNTLALGGFLLSIGLLLLFSLVLISVLVRRLAVPCGCFGNQERPVSWLDVGRNAGLVLCAAIGLISLLLAPTPPALPGITRLLLALMAAACALLWTRLDALLVLWRAHAF